MKVQTPKDKRRRMLVAIPILVLPFITFAFWALGGGKGNAEAKTANIKGLNLQLPDAHNTGGPTDKMSYYDQANADSLKRREQSQNDPYYHNNGMAAEKKEDSMIGNIQGQLPANASQYGNGSLQYHDPNEAKVYEKLGALNKALQQPTVSSYNGYSQPGYPNSYGQASSSINTMDVDRLEKMMQSMQSRDSGEDPETKQLNGMLEKILDIQHPERVHEKIKQSEDQRKGQVYAVNTARKGNRISTMDNSPDDMRSTNTPSTGFYGLDDSTSDDEDQNAIEAVVHEDQTLVNGSIVKLRLLNDINVHGTIVPKDNFIYGTVALEGERLTVKIKSLRYKKSLYPVQLSVFDIDGIDGIYIPGAIARDVAKSSADRSIQTFGLTSFDQSLGAQAAGAGIEAAKSFLSKKIKLIKVMVKAGYRVLLRDDKQKQE
ncbi:Bacteroides conjugative transposon TraM protein [Mucilaginibacter gossypiicola]|uniref:Bacteroides conjugative transposon TraM protein n=1 Tax=Mucilaginibacter gossypiicola TaxID=551995 RepID=A0A1H8HMM9_9SPHI|nr:conjugative transposon protein TraM [Mucilaginibacter gossypiicola]SEN57439.1 Bacteroides conjugative transposon TraM protein [Mucilaginibacter gossypiicola]